jgi:hypothetical protein
MYLKVITDTCTHVFESSNISYKTAVILPSILGDEADGENTYYKYRDIENKFSVDDNERVCVFLVDLGTTDFVIFIKDCIKAAYVMNENGKTIDTPIHSK